MISDWTIDLEQCTATHRDGWAFRFEADPHTPLAWDGELIAQPDPLPADAMRIIARLSQEAGEAYGAALRQRH